MVDYVKKKIVEKLAKFTKNLKPSDISVSFLSGRGHLSNLELNAEFISGVLQLPSWVSISRVLCDSIKARVPFTNLKTDPVNFYIGQVLIDITTATQATSAAPTSSNSSSSKLLDKLGNPSKYGLIEKVIDGMRVEIRSVLIFLKDPTFHAQLEMTEILLQSTSPSWQQVPLSKSRLYLDDEDSVINYKLCTWSSLKIEGWSTTEENSNTQNQLRLIVGATSIRISFKRKVSDSSLMAFRISMHLGDLIWILTQSQLRAVSRLVQSLMDTAVHNQQQKRSDRESDEESIDSLESVTSTNDRGKPNAKTTSNDKGKRKKQSRSSQRHEKVFEERMKEYMDGRRNLPSHEVIQNSFHLKTGKVDLQLCDDTSSSGNHGSLLIQIFQLGVDLYLNQPACSGRAHWNKSNDVITLNTIWSRDLVSKASKTQYVDLPSIHLGYLRERGVVIRCADFSVGTLKNDTPKSPTHPQHAHVSLPIVASDKKTFNIPDDVHNPAFQVGLTMYFYADKYGNRFLIPRPNVSVYVSPVHVNVHQETCLWLVEFVYGVVRTVNIELAMSVKDEGMSFLEERKASQPQVHQLPGFDLDFKILFTKVTLPVLEGIEDGRPKALQIETAAVTIRNPSLHHLLGDSEFEQALDVLRTDWLLQSQDTPQFPHYDNDLRALPSRLRDLLQQKVRVGRRRGERSSSVESGDSTGVSSRSTALAPEETRSEMSVIEGWHVSTSCVQVSFVSTLTHKATLYTTPLINDFPVNAWIFLPPSSLDAKLHTPTSPTHISASPGAQTSLDPRISFIVHIGTPMRVEITRLQLLFLMRLKDSLNAFKSSLMRFLDPEALSPGIKETLDARNSGKESSAESMSIAGYVAISRVEASLLLPSLYTSRPSRSTNTDSFAHSTTQEARATNSVEVTVAYAGESEETAVTGGVVIDNQPNHTHLSTSGSLASLSTAESELASSLGGCRGSLESLSVGGMSGGLTPSPSGSLASLPVIMETESPATNSVASKSEDPSRPSSATHPTSTATSHSTSLSDSPDYLPISTTNIPGSAPTVPGSAPTASGFMVPSRTVLHSNKVDRVSMPTEARANHSSSPSRQSDDEFVVISTFTLGDKPHPPQPHLPPPLPSEVVQTHGTSSANHPTVSTGTSSASHPTLSTGTSSASHPTLSPSLTSTNLTSESSKSSLLSPSSQRKLKSPAFLRTIPEYILHAEVKHICVVPNIRNGAITARVAIDTVGVRELTEEEHKGMKEMAKKKHEVTTASQSPSIKARLEVGSQVKRFYAEDCSDTYDIIVIAAAEGLDLTLLLPNMTVLKDFFDDEYATEKPLSLHMKVAGTRAVLMEHIEHSADHMQSMSVAVDQLEVHKGRELAPGLDVFRQDLNRFEPDEMCEGEEDVTDSCDTGKDQQLLLDSFSQFKAAFEAHVHNGAGVLSSQTMSLLQSQLQHLHAALISPPPPPYTPPAIAMTRKRSSTILSTHSELLNLRRELESLRHVQRESERLSAQVRESQVALDRQMAEFLMVTDECKRVKGELVSYKQVMEKQQEHIDRMLSENFDLRCQLESLPR